MTGEVVFCIHPCSTAKRLALIRGASVKATPPNDFDTLLTWWPMACRAVGVSVAPGVWAEARRAFAQVEATSQ